MSSVQGSSKNLRLEFVASSDRGLVRGNNEDSAYAGPNLLALADGMGGHAAGEVASQMMIEHLEHLDKNPADADMLALLGAAADDANAAIAASVREHSEQEGMGTTLTAVMFNGEQLGLIHVGDSRGYLLRDGTLKQLTVDDTFVQSLVDEGKLAPEDVSSHPQKSLILKAYTGRDVTPHLEMVDVQAGDRLLLCSDGLSDPVTAETIGVALGQGTVQNAADRLIELALRSGGPDNVTVVVAEVVGGGAGASISNEAPVKAGALAPSFESTHPDSSAGRAAALLRKSETIEPDHNRAKLQPADAAGDDAEGPQRSTWPWVIGALLLALILAFSATMWMRNKTPETYNLTTDEQGVFVIETGRGEPVQQVCLDSKNTMRTQPYEEGAKSTSDCHLFSQSDLPESQRDAAERLPSGTYDEVLGMLGRLADEALPVCVDGDKTDKTETDKPDAEQPKCREVK